MKIVKQFKSLVIEDDIEQPDTVYQRHSHNYYNLVYIKTGAGEHYLNNFKTSYNAGDLFVLAPEDIHNFDIRQTTHLYFIRFTESYFERYDSLMPKLLRQISPLDITRLSVLKENRIYMPEPFAAIIDTSFQSIFRYVAKQENIESSPTVFYLILSIFSCLHEIAKKANGLPEGLPVVKEDLVNYIHQNIYSRANLSISTISETFRVSPNYFSTYFKKRFEVNYKDYVDQYRDQLIEARVRSGNFSSTAIAEEFGFSDKSHFIRYFKKRFGTTPKQFRIASTK